MEEKDMPKTLIELVQALPNYVRTLGQFDLDKQIGKGGFGEVWHAVDNKTGDEVAVKELFMTKLTGKFLKTFIREVFTNAKCRDKYVIPLVGFTVEPPFCIITSFASGGSLVDYVFPGMPKYDTLKGTTLTMIAMCLAHALSKVQKLNVVHRDIKPANVLLNSKKLPFLCDFGIARIIDTENFMTRRSGTIIYMAPELYTRRDYDTMVDVYSYGILLYEMSEGKHAYDNYTRDMMVNVLVEGNERPPFSKKTNGKLKELICSCWDKDPQKRPTFASIYKRFTLGKVGFDGYDSKKVTKFVTYIEEQDKVKVKEPHHYVSLEKTIAQLRARKEVEKDEGESEDSQEETPVTSEDLATFINFDEPGAYQGNTLFAKKLPRTIADSTSIPQKAKKSQAPYVALDPRILSVPQHNQWFNHLHGVAQSLKESEFNLFFDITSPYIANPTDELYTTHIQYAYCEAMRANTSFIQFCYMKTLFFHLPIQTPAILQRSLDIMAMLFMHQTHLITAELTEWVNYFLSYLPEDMIIVMSHFIRVLPSNIGPIMPILDVIISQASRFFGLKCGDLYLTTLAYLVSTNQTFARLRFEAIRPIILYFTNSQFSNVSASAYSAIARLWDGQFPLDFQLISNHATDKEIAPAIAALFMPIYNIIPATHSIIHMFLVIASLCDQALIIPLLMAQINPEAAFIIARDQSWFSSGLPDAIGTFKLTLCIFGIPQARNELIRQERFPHLLTYLAEQPDNYIIGSISIFISKSNPSPMFIQALSQAGFFRKFVASLESIRDANSLVASSLIVDYLAQIGQCNDYPLFVHTFIELIQAVEEALPRLTTALVTLSQHRNVALTMKQQGVINYFYNVQQKYPQLRQIVQTGINNLSV